jgi:hypothetical protein
MGGTCGTYGAEEWCVQGIREGNTRIDLKLVGKAWAGWNCLPIGTGIGLL